MMEVAAHAAYFSVSDADSGNSPNIGCSMTFVSVCYLLGELTI